MGRQGSRRRGLRRARRGHPRRATPQPRRAAPPLNYDLNGFRSLTFSTARRLPAELATPARDAFVAANPAWGDPATWVAIRRASGPVTDYYLLAALDQRRDASGAIVGAPPTSASTCRARTFGIAAAVTLICLVLGFPLAYLLATLPPTLGKLLIILVLLPFWTSLLVRTRPGSCCCRTRA